MESIIKDIRFAVRTLQKNIGFTIIAVLMIALGIGACASIFSVVNAVLLQPLPYNDPSRLVLIWTELRARNVLDFPFPIPDVKDLRAEAKSYDGIAGLFAPGRAAIGGDDTQPEQIRVGAVTPNMFSLLGARFYLGRDFKEEDGTPNAPAAPGPNVAPPPRLPTISILSYNFWQRRYGGDPAVIGRMVDLGGGRAEIVGILAPGFELLFPPRTGIDSNVDMWTALRLNFDTAARNTGALRVIARLKPGVTLERAQAEAEGIAAEFRTLYDLKKNADVHFRVVPMHEDIVREIRPSILALFGAVLFVLLIACSNVANLLVVHAAARHRELVIRAAIGGSRWRLIRQMLTESAILAAIGGTLGLLLAQAGVDLLLALAPAKLPRISGISVDPLVVAFTATTAILTMVIFGVLPAFRASRPDIVEVLRVSGGAPGLRAGRWLRYTVVTTELALSFVLLVGFGLMFRSFIALQRVDPGYDPNHVLTFLLQAPQQTPEGRAAFLKQVNERLASLPDVETVSAASPLPLDGGVVNVPWATEAAAADPSGFRQANFHIVRPGYFETLKTKLLAGRTFTNDDNTPAGTGVVIDSLLAARAFPNEPAVGKTFLIRNLRTNGPNAPRNEKVQVIGVVQHQRHETMSEEGREAIFFVEQYFGAGSANRWIIRTKGRPEAIAGTVRAAIAELDPKLPLAELQPMTALVDKSMGPTRFAMLLIGIFAAIAGVMATIGLYGVLSTVVRQRTAEIGMRIVFGATRGSILRLIIIEGLRLSTLGVVAGLATAFVVTGLLRSMLVAVTPTDPATYGLITLLFVSIAVIASWLPARRAARLDPGVAFREE